MTILFLLAACTAPDPTVRQPGDGDDSDDPTTPDTDDTAGTTPDVEVVDVAHDREFRAVWVATVSNIDFPSSTSLDADEMKAELVDILEVMEQSGLNVIVFQVRPEGDA